MKYKPDAFYKRVFRLPLPLPSAVLFRHCFSVFQSRKIMSLFANLFGMGSKGEKPLTTSQAIQKLRETEDMLMKKQEFLEKKIEQEVDTAKKNGTKNKRGTVNVING